MERSRKHFPMPSTYYFTSLPQTKLNSSSTSTSTPHSSSPTPKRRRLDRHHYSRHWGEYGVEACCDYYSCLVDVLGRAGRLQEAYEVIEGMPVEVTAKAWGALLGACRNFGELRLAEVAARALAEVEPGNASVGRMEEAERVRREMKERGVMATAGSSWVVYSEA